MIYRIIRFLKNIFKCNNTDDYYEEELQKTCNLVNDFYRLESCVSGIWVLELKKKVSEIIEKSKKNEIFFKVIKNEFNFYLNEINIVLKSQQDISLDFPIKSKIITAIKKVDYKFSSLLKDSNDGNLINLENSLSFIDSSIEMPLETLNEKVNTNNNDETKIYSCKSCEYSLLITGRWTEEYRRICSINKQSIENYYHYSPAWCPKLGYSPISVCGSIDVSRDKPVYNASSFGINYCSNSEVTKDEIIKINNFCNKENNKKIKNDDEKPTLEPIYIDPEQFLRTVEW